MPAPEPVHQQRAHDREHEAHCLAAAELRLAACTFAHVHGHLDYVEPFLTQASSDSTSGAPLEYGLPRAGIASRFAAYIPLVASWKGRPSAVRIARRKTEVPNRRLREGS
jgi:hypothetical protein